MIPRDSFARLRLSRFLPPEECVVEEEWEYLDRVWTCEMSGFTQFCHARDGSFRLGALSLHLADLPAAVAAQALRELDLPIGTATTIGQLRELCGAPGTISASADDRQTLGYADFQRSGLTVGFTVLNEGGLVYLTVSDDSLT